MGKIIIILLSCIIATLAGKLPESSTKSLTSIKVEVVEDINAVLLANPKSFELKKELLQVSANDEESRKVIRYTLGDPHPADARLAEVADSYYYQIPQDFQLQLTYPDVGVGGVVKHIEILVDQSNNSGSAYIIAGGLGERFIRILVEAKKITYFTYRASFYGNV